MRSTALNRGHPVADTASRPFGGNRWELTSADAIKAVLPAEMARYGLDLEQAADRVGALHVGIPY